MYKVFISHSNHPDDWKRIESLENWLKGLEVVPVLARRIHMPDTATSKIESLIEESDAIIAFWTKNSSKSGFVNQEIGYAHKKKPIFIIQDHGVSLTGFVYGADTIKLGLEDWQQELNRFKESLLRLKSGKELGDAIIWGLVGIAAIIGGIGLFIANK
ncbi:MAG: TIR domain-containing protein [Candidatus Thorarchaeota archaeon]